MLTLNRILSFLFSHLKLLIPNNLPSIATVTAYFSYTVYEYRHTLLRKMSTKEDKPMSVRSNKQENQSKMKGSSYHTRQTYLQVMRQFMADENNFPHPQTYGDIEEYFLYEKRISDHIRKLLAHSEITS